MRGKQKNLLLIHNARLVDAETDIRHGAILLRGDKIEGLPTAAALKELLADDSVAKFDARGGTVMPSFIDMHAHFRDPGFTQKEDIESGSHAAAAGGFGTLVLMPNTKPVVSSMALAEQNIRKGQEYALAQLIQSISITKDFSGTDISHLAEIDAKRVPLITEDGHEVKDSDVMFRAMQEAARKKLIVSCHCEDPFLAAGAQPLRRQALELLAANGGKASAEQKKQAAALLRQANTLLELAEDCATFRNIRLAQQAGCHLHLCHVSTARCLEAVRQAKAAGMSISCEVTPHHLGLAGDKAPLLFQIVNPPLRSEQDRLAAVQALADGTADVIATDHAPHTDADKQAGSPGFSGLETAFATCYTTLVLGAGMSLSKLSSLMSARPAELLGLQDRGFLRAGYKADLTVVDTEAVKTIRGKRFASKGTYTPLEGKKLCGDIAATFFRGTLVFQREEKAVRR